MNASRTHCLLFVAALGMACSSNGKTQPREPAPDAPSAPSDGPVLGPADATPSVDAAIDAATCDLTGDWSFGSPACNACVQMHCCGEIGACQADSQCTAYLHCRFGCLLASQSCLDECDAMYPTAATEYETFTTCLANSGCQPDCS